MKRFRLLVLASLALLAFPVLVLAQDGSDAPAAAASAWLMFVGPALGLLTAAVQFLPKGWNTHAANVLGWLTIGIASATEYASQHPGATIGAIVLSAISVSLSRIRSHAPGALSGS